MPFSLIIIGLILIIAGYNGTQDKLFGMISKVFKEADGFAAWVLISIILGVLASIKEIREPVNAFIILLCIGLVVTLEK